MTPIPSLLALPDPIFDESPASWMLRLCHYHQSWPNQICGALGLRKITDFDVELSLESLHKLSYATSVKEASLSCLDSMFFHVRSSEQRRAAFLLNLSPRGYSSYRYCPDCLREDPVPYWRFTWRMAYFQICPTHRCLLLDRCFACGTMLAAFPVRTQGFFEDSTQPICRFCLDCRADLGRFQAEILPDCGRLRAVLALQRVVTAALLRGWFSVSDVEGRFGLDDLPRILMTGVRRCEEGSGAAEQVGRAICLPQLNPHAEERQPTNAEMPGERMVTLGDYHAVDLRQSANMTWKACFLDAVDEIKRMNN